MSVPTSLATAPRRVVLASAAALALGVLGGCGSGSHSPGMDAGADGGIDAGRDGGGDGSRDAAPDGGDGGLACGERTCSAGQVCCPGCPGEPPLGCADSPDTCPVLDCPPPIICDDTPCGEGQTCCREVCPGERPFCTDRPEACVPRPCPPPMMCGSEECTPGQVCCPGCPGEPPLGCADSVDACPVLDCPPPDACNAMDARGVGPCEEVLGVAWNGSACVTLSGCRCSGSDCEHLFDTLAACEGHYMGLGCIRDCRTIGCRDGFSCQLCFTSWECIPDGAVC